MKRLDIVTVLFNGNPESPGIVVSEDFTTEGQEPSLTVLFLLPTGGGHIIRAIPHESGIEASYKWREYSGADFNVPVLEDEGAGGGNLPDGSSTAAVTANLGDQQPAS